MAKRILSQLASRLVTSRSVRDSRRRHFERRRQRRGLPHELHYFHRVDDPYCELMVAVLPAFAERFGAQIVPHVVQKLDGRMYPERELLQRYAMVDAARLAALYDIGTKPVAAQPEPEACSAASLYLAGVAAQDEPAEFFVQAERVHESLHRGEPLPAASLTGRTRLAKDGALLRSLGHYLTATVHYGREWYWGLDRLDHLETRLIGLGLERSGRGTPHFVRTWRGLLEPVTGRGGVLELFFSLRSPYSYIAYFVAKRFADAHGLTLELKPVLPMVMRGMPVPLAKAVYILRDAKREADKHGLAFGKVADPLGAGIERAYAVAWYAREHGCLTQWLDSAFCSVAVRPTDMARDRGLSRTALRAGIPWQSACEALADESWRDWVVHNRDEMSAEGLWGVPCLRYRGVTAWGQDRFWVIRRAIEKLSA